MSLVTQTPQTVAGVNKIWRKVQGDIADGIQFECEEWALLDELKNADFDWSLREVTAPVDINEDGGVASIDEGAFEAVASSPNAEEITVAPIFLNKRFEASRFLMYIDANGGDTQIRKTLKHQSLHAVRAIARQFSDYFYGSATAILALTDSGVTATATQTITLYNAYGRSDVPGNTAITGNYIANLFRKNERVAILNAGALLAVGKITAITKGANPTLAITYDTVPAANATTGLQIVKANSLDNTTNDYNRGLVGMVDGLFATSVHGLSKAVVPNWDLAVNDSSGGRYSGIRLHYANDEIINQGGGSGANKVFMDQGVYRDQVALYQASLRYSDPFSMEMDGEVKSKNRKFFKSRRMIPGYAVACDISGLQRWTLLPKPNGAMRWKDGKEREDRSAIVFRMDVPVQLIWRNRKKFTAFTGLTRQ